MQDKKFKFGTQQIIPLVCLVVAVLFFCMGLGKFGFWRTDSNSTHGPTPGFYPIIISIALFIFSLVAFIQSLGKESKPFNKDAWMVPAGFVVLVGCIYVFGVYVSVLAYMLLWLKVFEKCSWKTTIITTVVIMGIVIGAFGLWLGIDFPKGFIGDLIF